MPQIVTFSLIFLFIALASQQIGKLFSRFNIPYITGYLFAGAVAGPFVLELLPSEATTDLRYVDNISLAIIAFIAGSELYLKELQGRFRFILGKTFGIMLAAFVLGGIVIYVLTGAISFTQGMTEQEKIAVAVLGSTILLALSPASTIAVIKEVRAKGTFTKTILGVTVSMDVVIIILFAVSASIAAALLNGDSLNVGSIALILVDLVAAFASGYLVGRLLQLILGLRVPSVVKIAGILFVGWSIFAIGMWLVDFSHDNLPFEIHIEPLLVAVIGGFYVTNFTAYRSEFDDVLHDVGPLVYVAFFTLTGLSLKLDILIDTLPIAATLFVVRAIGIFIGAYGAGCWLGENPKHSRVSWMAFITQAGIALGLAREVAVEFPTLGDAFATMIVSVVVLNEIIGPMFLKNVLRRVGEAAVPDKAEVDDRARDAVIFGVEGQSLALARELKQHGWKVILVDMDSERVKHLVAEDVDERIIDTVSYEAVKGLITPNTDAVIAMMEDDEANYQICEIARDRFAIRRIIVRLTDVSHSERFTELGAVVVDPTTALIQTLDQTVRVPQSSAILMHRDPQYEIIQMTITDKDVHGQQLRDLRLPADVLVLSVSHQGRSLVPHGYTALHLDDEVTLVGKPDSLREVVLKFGY